MGRSLDRSVAIAPLSRPKGLRFSIRYSIMNVDI